MAHSEDVQIAGAVSTYAGPQETERRGKPARCPGRAMVLRTLVAIVVAAGAVNSSFAGDGPDQAPVIALGHGKHMQSIIVASGKSENVHTDASFVEVVVGDPDIADAVPLTDHSLSILGKKVGTTRVSVYGEGKQPAGVFDVEVSYDIAKLAAELSRRFPHAKIKVSAVNGRIMLSGDAPDATTLDQAVVMAREFDKDVINSVRVLQAQQVMLEVRFVEISRTASRELGIAWNAVAKNLNVSTGTASLLSGNAPFGTIMATLLSSSTTSIDTIIQALEEREVARRLAEPNLVTLSGDPASFLAGGEFPFPVLGQNGQPGIQFKNFGVGLAFTPTVLDNGMVDLKIEPEVSQLDTTNVITVAGTTIPGLIVRRASTTIELRDGQSFAMAGLLQNTGTTNQQQLPWLGDVPVLGTLFRSAQYQKQETDLVIIVTVHLVRPARPGDVMRTPIDNSVPGNDADFFLLGQAELTPTMRRQFAGIAAPTVGHILDLPQGGSDAAKH